MLINLDIQGDRESTKMESVENEEKGITFMDLVVYFSKHGVSHLVGDETKDSVDSSDNKEARWKPFEVFNRETPEGETVMTSPDGIVEDFLPGFENNHRIGNVCRRVRLPQHCQVLRSSADQAGLHHHRGGQVLVRFLNCHETSKVGWGT